MAKKNAATVDKPEGPGFEELLAEAESLAGKMEEGGLTLDESIRAYEKGLANLRQCADLLRAAEEKVKMLVEKDGAFSLRDLDVGEDGLDGEGEDGDGEDDY